MYAIIVVNRGYKTVESMRLYEDENEAIRQMKMLTGGRTEKYTPIRIDDERVVWYQFVENWLYYNFVYASNNGLPYVSLKGKDDENSAGSYLEASEEMLEICGYELAWDVMQADESGFDIFEHDNGNFVIVGYKNWEEME